MAANRVASVELGGERTGVDWPDHCMRLLPADETAMAELEVEDAAAEVAP